MDNVEATLSEFIPPGVACLSSPLDQPSEKYLIGYETDEKTFRDIVERDATGFRPIGNRIHSYQRISPSSRGKGKGVASATNLDPGSEDVIEYEVYHVGILLSSVSIQALGLTLGSVDVGHTGIQGVPPTNANIYSPLYRGWLVHYRG